MKRRLQRVVDLGADAHAIGEARRAGRNDHELLKVDLVVGVRAAVEDIHHRHRQQPGLLAAEIAPQGKLARGGTRLRRGERDAEHRVRSEPLLGPRTVKLDQARIERLLVGRIDAGNRRGDLVVDVGDRA